jgi:hypothetical protein
MHVAFYFLTHGKGVQMVVVFKFVGIAVSGGLFLLIGRFVDEYFRPYKRKG